MDNEQLLDWLKENMATKSDLAVFKEQIAQVVAGNATELHQQIENMGARFSVRFDSIDRRLDFHTGILTSLTEWTGKYESELIRVSKELDDVKTRLAKLESKEAA